MGIEVQRYLIPRPNTFRPDLDAVLALVEALRAGGWMPLADTCDYARVAEARGSVPGAPTMLVRNHAESDLLLGWSLGPLSTSTLRLPLDPPPFDDPRTGTDWYYDLQLHLGREFVYLTSETIDPFDPPPRCTRGHALELESEFGDRPFFAPRLATRCATCGETFDPTRLLATGRDGWTGDPVQLQGGATYRFAIMIDCGKYFPGVKRMSFHPEFKALVEDTLANPFYEIENFA
jgi:hypothetical protein